MALKDEDHERLEFLDGLLATLRKYGVAEFIDEGVTIKMAPPEPPAPKQAPAVDPELMAALENLKGDSLAEASGIPSFRKVGDQ